MTERTTSHMRASGAEQLLVLVCAVAASLVALGWSWSSGALLNYGDAVAHLHIARRVLDSHNPCVAQLGSVWLPLPHLLDLPFVMIDSWWANGLAGVIPSALAYVASCVAIYRLARRWMAPLPAAFVLVFFGLNPNLLYLQTTAMTEPLFLCEMVWIALWLVEWREALDEDSAKASRLLILIAIGLVAAVYTRYDGWIMTALAWTGIGVELLRRRQLGQWTYWLLTLFVAAAPLAWFWYNQHYFGDWLEFQRGPYSAKAIELRTTPAGSGPPHPGWHNMFVSAIFFLKAAEMDAIVEFWGNLLLLFTVTFSFAAWRLRRHHGIGWALQLLWLPAPFYAYSVAYGSVPIFLPPWWPHSWYNTRYGMELLPAFALGVGFVAVSVLAVTRKLKSPAAGYAPAILALLLVANAAWLVHARPLVYVEGTKNMEAHGPYQRAIPPVLRAYLAHQPGARILMVSNVDPEIIALTGIHLRQTINEGDLSEWSRAQKSPAALAPLVLAFDGDPIDQAVKAHPENLQPVAHFEAKGQPAGTLYVSTLQTAGTAASRR